MIMCKNNVFEKTAQQNIWRNEKLTIEHAYGLGYLGT